MNPTPATIEMWTHVLEEVGCLGWALRPHAMILSQHPVVRTRLTANVQVHRGGWDQTQYGYWASTMSDRIKQFAINQAFIPRSQNAFDQIELKRMQKLLDTTEWSVLACTLYRICETVPGGHVGFPAPTLYPQIPQSTMLQLSCTPEMCES